ncbi:MAG: hypothetical protein V2I43_19345 [Parvularcula sp.]|jgi:hypothetical protein|nr:hypothetical protein [Parvularcula sp.]
MYLENKSSGLNGPARIGLVTFSKSGKSIHYDGMTLQRFRGYKANYIDVGTGEEYWVSGPRKDGNDRLYPQSSLPVLIDGNIAEQYWRDIREMRPPE